MGYGILRVDFAVLKAALFLPEDCRITAVRHVYDGGETAWADLVVERASFPDAPMEKIPMLSAVCTVERPDEHVCPDGFECKKITTTLDLPSQVERTDMGMVPPTLLPFMGEHYVSCHQPFMRRRNCAQPKEDHPMQEIWDRTEEYQRNNPPQGGSVIALQSHGTVAPTTDYGGVVPIPRVNPDLITEEYR